MKADDFPKYGVPSRVVVGLAFATVLGLRRSFREDAIRCIEKLKPPLQVLGQDHIPLNGSCVITVNHYHRPGFGAQWLALAISACVPCEMHWVMNNPVVTAPIIGPRTMEHLTSALKAAKVRFKKDELKKIDKIWPGPGGAAPEAYAW